MIEVREPTQDDIDKIFFDDEIYSRIADDTCPTAEEFKKLFKEEIGYDIFKYCGLYLDDKIIGLSNIDDGDKFHFAVLKPYRAEYAKICLELSLRFFKKSVYCHIPLVYPEVIAFAKMNCFKAIGLVKNTYLKAGISYNILQLDYEFSI